MRDVSPGVNITNVPAGGHEWKAAVTRQRRNVCFWQQSDIVLMPMNVRFWVNSGHQRATIRCLLLTQSGHSQLRGHGSATAHGIRSRGRSPRQGYRDRLQYRQARTGPPKRQRFNVGGEGLFQRRRGLPKVYFEEWDEPMISGIGWVSELIEVTGGVDVFADRASGKSAKDRIVTAEEVICNEPDIIIGSWCGKKHIAGSCHSALRELRRKFGSRRATVRRL
jgi:hypothetical protein